MEGRAERAVVTFDAPHGVDAVTIADGDVAMFGRDASCAVRFGFAPVRDLGVARVAGQFLAAGGRIFVESSDDPEHRALEVRAPGNPPVQLAQGEGYAPRTATFEVVIHGERAWTLQVAVRRDSELTASDSSAEPPTRGFDLELTPMQRSVLDAYCEPVRRGRVEPATHKEVAAALSYHPNSVREALYEIYARMFAAGIPLLEVADKRVAVVEAARRHGLIAAEVAE